MSVSARLRFSVSVSMLFKEVAFLERFERAAKAGFAAVEFFWPAGERLGDVAAAVADAGLDVAVFNFDAGEMERGDRGLLGDPRREERFRANVPVALELAERLGCRRLNALAGLELPDIGREAQLDHAARLLAWTAAKAEAAGLDVLLEPLNTFENGPALLFRTEHAVALVDRVEAANVRLQYDVYHMQRMEGNLAETLRARSAILGHVQIADSPGRGEPGTGEINYPYLFRVLDDLGYEGFVGLEYNPTATTDESLEWLPRERRGRAGLGRKER